MSRAIGDYHLKRPQPWVSNEPGVTEVDIKLAGPSAPVANNIIILASDGLWDVMSNEDAVRMVHRSEAWAKQDPRMAARGLVETALRRGTKDNVSVIVAML